MKTSKNTEKTRAKLIEAAGALFAEKGFAAVTVREIVKAAEVHLGALNYHFRSKEELYGEVLLHACNKEGISEKDQQALLKLEPREALYVVIREAVKEYKNKTGRNWEAGLISRECLRPSSAFDQAVEKYFRPQTDFMARLVGGIVGKPADSPRVRFAVISLFGLLDTFGEYGNLLDAAAPGLKDYLGRKNRLAKLLMEIVIESAGKEEK